MSGNVYVLLGGQPSPVLQGVSLFSKSGDDYTFKAADAAPPPPQGGQIIVPAGRHRKTTGAIGWTVQALAKPKLNLDLTNMSWAYARAAAGDRPLPFFGTSGANPVITSFERGACVISELDPIDGIFSGTMSYESNIGGPAVEMSISMIGGDFGDHGSCLWSTRTATLPNGQLRFPRGWLPDGSPNCRFVIGQRGPATPNPNVAYIPPGAKPFFNLMYFDPAASGNFSTIWRCARIG